MLTRVGLNTAITIATKGLVQTASIHETIRIKSAAWDDTGILVYTTLNHIKYALPSGFVSFCHCSSTRTKLTR